MTRPTAIASIRQRIAASIAACAIASGLAWAPSARADPRPLRIDYQAHAGCPGAEVLVEEILWRTSLARIAAQGEDAIEARARIDRRGAVSRGHLVLGRGRERVTRDIEGSSCDEVVSALGLVVALHVDPRAATGKKPPAAPPAPPLPPSRPTPPMQPPPVIAVPRGSVLRAQPEMIAPPLPALPSPAPIAATPRWAVGVAAALDFGAAPRPMGGGALFVERALDARWDAALRLSAEVLATGEFEVGPGGASFLRAIGRFEGCALTLRPARRIAIVPCVALEGGVIRGAGVIQGSLTNADQATVPWAAVGLLPRIAVDAGATIELQAGPVLPLVRRTFQFERPEFVVHEVPAVTAHVSLGVGVRFP